MGNREKATLTNEGMAVTWAGEEGTRREGRAGGEKSGGGGGNAGGEKRGGGVLSPHEHPLKDWAAVRPAGRRPAGAPTGSQAVRQSGGGQAEREGEKEAGRQGGRVAAAYSPSAQTRARQPATFSRQCL